MKLLAITMIAMLTMSGANAMSGKVKGQERYEKLQKELNLTSEQLTKVKEIKKKFREDVKASRAPFRDSRKAFREAMNNPTISNEDLSVKFETFQKLRDDHHRKRFQMLLAMREIMTPDQIAKFSDWRKDRRQEKMMKQKK